MPGGDSVARQSASQSPLTDSDQSIVAPVDSGYSPNPPKVLALLQEAAAALANIEAHAHLLKPNADIDQLVDGAASSVEKLRADRLRRAMPGHPHEHHHIYQLVGTEIDQVLITLRSHHSVAIKLQSAQPEGISIRLVLCLLASNVGAVRAPQSTPELF